MKQTTHHGTLDSMFFKDRHAQLDSLPTAKRIPSYGQNSLRKPKRALTKEEADIVRSIGLPPRPSGK